MDVNDNYTTPFYTTEYDMYNDFNNPMKMSISDTIKEFEYDREPVDVHYLRSNDYVWIILIFDESMADFISGLYSVEDSIAILNEFEENEERPPSMIRVKLGMNTQLWLHASDIHSLVKREDGVKPRPKQFFAGLQDIKQRAELIKVDLKPSSGYFIKIDYIKDVFLHLPTLKPAINKPENAFKKQQLRFCVNYLSDWSEQFKQRRQQQHQTASSMQTPAVEMKNNSSIHEQIDGLMFDCLQIDGKMVCIKKKKTGDERFF